MYTQICGRNILLNYGYSHAFTAAEISFVSPTDLAGISTKEHVSDVQITSRYPGPSYQTFVALIQAPIIWFLFMLGSYSNCFGILFAVLFAVLFAIPFGYFLDTFWILFEILDICPIVLPFLPWFSFFPSTTSSTSQMLTYITLLCVLSLRNKKLFLSKRWVIAHTLCSICYICAFYSDIVTTV